MGRANVTDTAYHAVVNTTGVASADYGKAEALVAASKFSSFLTALTRYDCDSSYIYKSSYSAWNCDDCRKAYAAWICSQFMVKCVPIANTNGSQCLEVKPCLDVCYNVVRKCPVSLGFQCPDYEGDYSHDNNATCNSMGIAAATHVGRYMSAVTLVGAAMIALQLN
jgi:hypothetical protein